MKATQVTKDYLFGLTSTLACRIKDFEFFQETRFIAILSNGKRIPGYEFNLFRGERLRFQKYLNTFI